MPLVDSVTCSKSINVPPRLPLILKQFCKAAIRTQPYDLLKWSSAYFRALAEGIEPPTKIRLEYPLPGNVSGLTLGFLKVLLRQFGDYNKYVSVEFIFRRWDDLCLSRRDLNLIMIIGRFRRKCQVKKFLAIAVGLLGASLFDTMLMICELFTLEPEGGSAMIPVSLFMELNGYLAGLRCDGSSRDPSDEDPREFLIADQSEPSAPQLSGDFNKNVEQKSTSLVSQGTEADIDLDQDNSTEDALKEFSGHVDATSQNISDSHTQGKDVVDTLHQENHHEDDEFNEEEKMLISAKDYEQSERPEVHRNRRSMTLPSELLSHYPDIPGIGPRLTPEEVATVAVWMTECARLQEGMVGPRNLRHFQCPPLDRRPIS